MSVATESVLETAYENRYQQLAKDIKRLKNIGKKVGLTDNQIEADLYLATDEPEFVARHAELMNRKDS